MRVTDQRITDFLSTLSLGLEFIGDAGKKLAAIEEDDSDCFQAIIDSGPPWITIEILRTMLAIGRGEIAPELLILPLHVFKRLSVLPPDQQVSAMQGVELAHVPRNGKPPREGQHTRMVYKKPACKLTKAEAHRAIGPNGIRTPAEQLGAMRNNRHKSLGWFQCEIFTDGKPILTRMESGPQSATETHQLLVRSGAFAVEFLMDR